MTKQLFDKSLMQFASFLSLTQKFMTPAEIAHIYSSHMGKKVTEKTIRNWFKHLKKNYFFDFKYWPEPRYESLGLRQAFVIADLKNNKVAKLLPYKTYGAICFDAKKMKNYYLLFYAIPSNKILEFEKFWKTGQKQGLVNTFEIKYYKGNVVLYTPHHEVLNERGYVDVRKEHNVSFFVELLKKELNNTPHYKINNMIARHPIVVPLTLEMRQKHHTHSTMWLSLKNMLGSKLFTYIPAARKKGESFGKRYLADVLSKLQQNFRQYFRQVRVEYDPIYSKENISIYIFAKLKNINKLPELAEKIAKRAINTNVCLPIKENFVMIHVTTSNKEAIKIQSEILPEYVDNASDNKIMWMNYDLTAKELWRTKNEVDYTSVKPNYWELFDPRNLTWQWVQEKYLNELKNLSD